MCREPDATSSKHREDGCGIGGRENRTEKQSLDGRHPQSKSGEARDDNRGDANPNGCEQGPASNERAGQSAKVGLETSIKQNQGQCKCK